jgi:hypothetical protein
MMLTSYDQPSGLTPWTFGADADPGHPGALDGMSVVWRAGRVIVQWPFDAMRAQHAAAVCAGLIERSILESRDFEHKVDALERLTLGPLARRA